jgi:hypothetical protein
MRGALGRVGLFSWSRWRRLFIVFQFREGREVIRRVVLLLVPISLSGTF